LPGPNTVAYFGKVRISDEEKEILAPCANFTKHFFLYTESGGKLDHFVLAFFQPSLIFGVFFYPQGPFELVDSLPMSSKIRLA
jgi:hypothetical protein